MNEYIELTCGECGRVVNRITWDEDCSTTPQEWLEFYEDGQPVLDVETDSCPKHGLEAILAALVSEPASAGK